MCLHGFLTHWSNHFSGPGLRGSESPERRRKPVCLAMSANGALRPCPQHLPDACLQDGYATDDVMRALGLRLQQLVGAKNGDAGLYIFGDNGALSTNMAAASLDAERGLAVLAKPPGSGMGPKEDPTFDNKLFGAGCEQERRTIPWAENMRTLLASVDECPTMHKPSLTELASNSAPSDDPDTMAIQQSILWNWVGQAGTLVSSTDQATELLRAALPTHSECTALLTLPRSLQTGFLKVNINQFNIEIADFADRAMRLRCCSEKEAWRICQAPLLTAAASLGELFEPLQHLPEAAAFDLHWYELARPSVSFWLLLEETSRQLQRTVSDSTELPAAQDGSFLLMALKGSTAKTRTPPIHYCSALLPMQVLFYAVRQLLDRPNDFPHLKITEVFWEHVENNVMEGPGYALGCGSRLPLRLRIARCNGRWRSASVAPSSKALSRYTTLRSCSASFPILPPTRGDFASSSQSPRKHSGSARANPPFNQPTYWQVHWREYASGVS